MQRPASIALGPYQLVERIGEGGSGQIYRAAGPDGPVAVKILGPASDMDAAARARFGREIAALGQLAHPNLIALLDHGIDAELGPYLVLPLLAGTNLRALCGGQALCPEAALLLVQPIAAAVAAVHAAGFVHRDLKPENAIAAPDGAITVIDFGLAWREGMTRHTDTGAAVGSVGYMAPEQIEGRAVDPRTDVWALGVMIYEWIVGKRPFARARASEEAAAVLLGTCPSLTAADRRCNEELAELVTRCLASDPARRPSAAGLAAALETMIDWTDAPQLERAAVVADPVGYQARIAPFRVQRFERIAREAIEVGRPFAALAACDRGLAYAPEYPQLLALVAAAESATARPRPKPRRWPWVVVAALGVAVGATVTYVLVPSARAQDPWANRPEPATPESVRTAAAVEHEHDLATLHDMTAFFGKVIDKVDKHEIRPGGATHEPTTATGWLELAGTQPPEQAATSLRRALELAPRWAEAEAALCRTLAQLHDLGAVGACDTAVRSSPDDVELQRIRASVRNAAK